MLDFIKKQLDIEPVQESANENDALLDTDNSLITEYAHLFQELSDVSEEGNLEETSERGRIGDVSISLEDDVDIEPDIVEMNLMNGCSFNDIPKDAANKTSIETESAQMKTFDDFFEEMYQNSFRFERESEENHISRIRRKANEAYQEYVDTCYQEGLFGFGDMDINDPKVPAAIAFDFGSACGMSSMMVQVPFKYITTDKRGKRMITKAQYECAALLLGSPNLMNAIIADFVNTFRQNFADRLGGRGINEVLMFQFIGIPKQQSATDYEVYIAADTGIAGVPNYDMTYEISKPGKRSSNITALPGAAPYTTNDGYTFTLVNPTMGISKSDFLTKNECVQLEYVANRPRRFDESFYQEAIDFEEDNTSSEEEEKTSSSEEEEKKDVDTNDVSDQIVDKLSENEDDNNDSSSDDDDNSDDNDEGATIGDDDDTSSEGDDSGDEGSVDEDLENLDESLEDSTDSEEETSEEEDEGISDESMEDMTVEELLHQGEEKLKGMTLKELKKFVSSTMSVSSDDTSLSDDSGDEGSLDAGLPSNDNPDDDDTDASSSNDDIEQEAFILTPKNINSELEINIRNCLGILNESDISSADIFKKFKKASKKLNRVSAKASNMSKVYTDDERKTIGDMNKALINLTLELRSSNEVASIKEKIKAFVNAAATVGKIVEAKKN